MGRFRARHPCERSFSSFECDADVELGCRMNFDALDAALDSPCDTDDEEFLPNVDADQILMAHVLERTNNNAYRE